MRNSIATGFQSQILNILSKTTISNTKGRYINIYVYIYIYIYMYIYIYIYIYFFLSISTYKYLVVCNTFLDTVYRLKKETYWDK